MAEPATATSGRRRGRHAATGAAVAGSPAPSCATRCCSRSRRSSSSRSPTRSSAGSATRRSSRPTRSACRTRGSGRTTRTRCRRRASGCSSATAPLVAGLSTVVVVLFAALAAFVLARREFPGREVAYTLFTLGLLFPATVAILPLLILVRDLGLLDNPLGLALPEAAFGLPLTIIILRPFFRSIPKELEDAAAIDGCGPLGFFFRILLPLVAAGPRHRRGARHRLELEPVPAAAGDAVRRGQLDAAARRHELQHAVHDRHRADPRLHDAGPDAGPRLLRRRRTPARRRPDRRCGQGMTDRRSPPTGTPPCRSRRASPTCSARMTRAEKFAQLGSVWAFEVVGADGLDADAARRARRATGSARSPAWPARRTCARSRSPRPPTRSSATSSRRPGSGSRRSSTRSACTG